MRVLAADAAVAPLSVSCATGRRGLTFFFWGVLLGLVWCVFFLVTRLWRPDDPKRSTFFPFFFFLTLFEEVSVSERSERRV